MNCKWQPAVISALLILMMSASGCNMMAWLGQGVIGEKPVLVTAAYYGLQNQSVAVLVSTSSQIESRYPRVTAEVCRAVSGAIARALPGAVVMGAQEATAFTQSHPGWELMPASSVARQLKVQRLVMIDIHDYRTHEPGNTHIWQGVLKATVDVIEADGKDPDTAVFRKAISTQYPLTGVVGLVSSNSAEIKRKLLPDFAVKVTRLFVDHEEML